MDSKDLAVQILFSDLQFLRRQEGATWDNYGCTTLLRPLWECQSKDEYSSRLREAVDRHVKDDRSADCVYAAFGIDSCEPSLLGVRRREIAAIYGISVRTVINRENDGLRAIAEGIIGEYPYLCGVTVPSTIGKPDWLSNSRLLAFAMEIRLEEIDALRQRFRKRIGYL